MAQSGGDRAQSNLVGAVLLFGVLVLAFASYQAVVVPQQNAEVEFQHSQRVQGDVLDVRNGVLAAAADGRQPFVEVELGTAYPSRALALNPPPATGTLRTTDAREITVENAAGDAVGDEVCPGAAESRLLRYEASYNEFRNGPELVVENTVAYRRHGRANRTMSTQRLLTGGTVNLVPIQGEYGESAVGTTSVEPIAGPLVVTSVTDPEITVPTALDEGTWNELLADELDAGESATVDDGRLTLDLRGSYRVTCAPVGINTPPPAGARNGGGFGDGGAGVNPAGANTVQLVDVRFDASSDTATLTFENTFDSDRTFQRARIPFYLEANRQGKEVERGRLAGRTDDELVVGEAFEPVGTVTVPGGGTAEVEIELDPDAAKGDFYGLSVVYNDSVTRRYFVEHPGGSGGSGGGTGGAPTFGGDPTVEDTSSGGDAGYEVTYRVDDPGGNFSRVEVTFDCTSCSGNSGDGTESSTATSDTVTYSRSNLAGEEYTIIAEVYDDGGSVTDAYAVSDTADGSDP